MKTKLVMDPAAAFPDPKHRPKEGDLKAVLGAAVVPIDQVFADLGAAVPGVTAEWKFSEQSGWYRIPSVKKRRLFYFIPKRGDFRLSVILGGKAIALLQQGPFAKETARLLQTAKKYPEGTAFSFDRRTLKPDLIAALLAAKIAH
jgi:hypothetical protein